MIRVALVYLCCWLVAATSSVRLCRVRSILPNINIYISTHIYVYNIYTYDNIYTYLRLPGQVDGSAKLGEGYNIVSGRDCARYCALIPECRHWTWYKHHCRANKWAVQSVQTCR